MKRSLIFIGLFILLAVGISFVFAQEPQDCRFLKCPGSFWNETAGECQCGTRCPITVSIASCDDSLCPAGHSLYVCSSIGGAPGPAKCINDMCEVILKLSSSTNAHGEIYSETNFNTNINYRDIFGDLYSNYPVRTCTKTKDNLILKLSDTTNAHAEGPEESNYLTEVCFGDLNCELVEGSCPSDKICVVKLSDTTNAHLETCDNTNYDYSVCCSGVFVGEVDCESLTTNTTCLAPGNNCTWTPPRKTYEQGGRCCGYQEQFQPTLGCVSSSEGNLCYNHFDKLDIQTTKQVSLSEANLRFDKTPPEYCAKISSDLSYGFWYSTESY